MCSLLMNAGYFLLKFTVKRILGSGQIRDYIVLLLNKYINMQKKIIGNMSGVLVSIDKRYHRQIYGQIIT